jgi:hypothetical protein
MRLRLLAVLASLLLVAPAAGLAQGKSAQAPGQEKKAEATTQEAGKAHAKHAKKKGAKHGKKKGQEGTNPGEPH